MNIVHFEDERYISRRPKVDDFIEDYTLFLKGNSNKKNPYRDPDMTCKKIYDMSEKLWGRYLPEIWCTDQLGFSAPSDKKTIYGKYLEESKDNDRFEFVAKCIYDTRTIGGCFIWPKVLRKGLGFVSEYNKVRGGKKGKVFLEDRADIALLEIKHFFIKYEEYGKKDYEGFISEYRSDESNDRWMIFDYTSHFPSNEKEYEKMFEWLTQFNSFGCYCEWFSFDDAFVRNEMVVDIVGSDLDDQKVEYLTEPVTESIYDLSLSDQKKMLDNIRHLVNARSLKIHSKIDA